MGSNRVFEREIGKEYSPAFARAIHGQNFRKNTPATAATLGLLAALVDVIDSLLHGRDFFGVFVRNFRFEFFLQGHH
jgi:hypothetical protein